MQSRDPRRPATPPSPRAAEQEDEAKALGQEEILSSVGGSSARARSQERRREALRGDPETGLGRSSFKPPRHRQAMSGVNTGGSYQGAGGGAGLMAPGGTSLGAGGDHPQPAYEGAVYSTGRHNRRVLNTATGEYEDRRGLPKQEKRGGARKGSGRKKKLAAAVRAPSLVDDDPLEGSALGVRIDMALEDDPFSPPRKPAPPPSGFSGSPARRGRRGSPTPSGAGSAVSSGGRSYSSAAAAAKKGAPAWGSNVDQAIVPVAKFRGGMATPLGTF